MHFDGYHILTLLEIRTGYLQIVCIVGVGTVGICIDTVTRTAGKALCSNLLTVHMNDISVVEINCHNEDIACNGSCIQIECLAEVVCGALVAGRASVDGSRDNCAVVTCVVTEESVAGAPVDLIAGSLPVGRCQIALIIVLPCGVHREECLRRSTAAFSPSHELITAWSHSFQRDGIIETSGEPARGHRHIVHIELCIIYIALHRCRKRILCRQIARHIIDLIRLQGTRNGICQDRRMTVDISLTVLPTHVVVHLLTYLLHNLGAALGFEHTACNDTEGINESLLELVVLQHVEENCHQLDLLCDIIRGTVLAIYGVERIVTLVGKVGEGIEYAVVAVVQIEDNKMELTSVAHIAEALQIVVRPVPVVHIELRSEVVYELINVHEFLDALPTVFVVCRLSLLVPFLKCQTVACCLHISGIHTHFKGILQVGVEAVVAQSLDNDGACAGVDVVRVGNLIIHALDQLVLTVKNGDGGALFGARAHEYLLQHIVLAATLVVEVVTAVAQHYLLVLIVGLSIKPRLRQLVDAIHFGGLQLEREQITVCHTPHSAPASGDGHIHFL